PILRGVKPFRALVDTGATSTMIAPRVVSALGLQQVNRLQFSGMGGLTWRPGYLFHVAFYERPPANDDTRPSKIHVLRKVINGAELLDEHTFDVLLGMDMITTGALTTALSSLLSESRLLRPAFCFTLREWLGPANRFSARRTRLRPRRSPARGRAA